jgi:hypothetical protein
MKRVLRVSCVLTTGVLLAGVAWGGGRAAPARNGSPDASTAAVTGAAGTPAAVAGAPPGTPATATSTEAEEGRPLTAVVRTTDEPTLPEFEMHDVPLQAVLEHLRDAAPQFQLVVVYEPGAPPDQPVITHLKLTRVTPSQVLEALSRVFAQVRVSRTEGAEPAVWTVQIRAPRSPDATRITRVFRLREAIDQVARETTESDGPAARGQRQQARSAVLALIDTALQADGGGSQPPPQLQFHEPTETLVFRGTKDEAVLVDDALGALRPRSTPAAAQLSERLAAVERQVGLTPGGERPAPPPNRDTNAATEKRAATTPPPSTRPVAPPSSPTP